MNSEPEYQKILVQQYEKFVLQLRQEVSQLFFLHNFFFGINGALLGSIFLKEAFTSNLLPVVKILGLFLTLYWFSIMSEKNRWREDWLERIKAIENELNIPENPVNLRMWPKDKCWKGGLSNRLFFWPMVFFGVVWFVLLLFPDLISDLGASIQSQHNSLERL